MRRRTANDAEPDPARPGCVQHVYLTFDDGPDADWTGRVLDLLAEANVRATFFVIGRFGRARPGLLRQIAARDHAIGNHTWSHRHPWTMSSPAARREVRDGARAIADIIGRPAELYRPPHGRARPCMTEEARCLGQRLVLWNRSAVDWGPLGHARAITARLARIRAGDVVLMHDGGGGINRPGELIQALPGFLEALSVRRLVPALPPP